MGAKWHENIPENGALCKESGTGFIFAVSQEMISTAPSLKDIERLTPLAPAEWWFFAPWREMKDALRTAEKVLLLFEIEKTVKMAVDKPHTTIVNSVGFRVGAKKWLPLPTGDL